MNINTTPKSRSGHKDHSKNRADVSEKATLKSSRNSTLRLTLLRKLFKKTVMHACPTDAQAGSVASVERGATTTTPRPWCIAHQTPTGSIEQLTLFSPSFSRHRQCTSSSCLARSLEYSWRKPSRPSLVLGTLPSSARCIRASSCSSVLSNTGESLNRTSSRPAAQNKKERHALLLAVASFL